VDRRPKQWLDVKDKPRMGSAFSRRRGTAARQALWDQWDLCDPERLARFRRPVVYQLLDSSS
jgi:hypothetical protein